MGTAFFECGCSVTTSMFGDKEVLSIHTCMKHANNPKIQEQLKALSKVLSEELLKEHENNQK